MDLRTRLLERKYKSSGDLETLERLLHHLWSMFEHYIDSVLKRPWNKHSVKKLIEVCYTLGDYPTQQDQLRNGMEHFVIKGGTYKQQFKDASCGVVVGGNFESGSGLFYGGKKIVVLPDGKKLPKLQAHALHESRECIMFNGTFGNNFGLSSVKIMIFDGAYVGACGEQSKGMVVMGGSFPGSPFDGATELTILGGHMKKIGYAGWIWIPDRTLSFLQSEKDSIALAKQVGTAVTHGRLYVASCYGTLRYPENVYQAPHRKMVQLHPLDVLRKKNLTVKDIPRVFKEQAAKLHKYAKPCK